MRIDDASSVKCDVPFSSSLATKVFRYWLAILASSTLLGLAPAAFSVGSIGDAFFSAAKSSLCARRRTGVSLTRLRLARKTAWCGYVDRLVEKIAVLGCGVGLFLLRADFQRTIESFEKRFRVVGDACIRRGLKHEFVGADRSVQLDVRIGEYDLAAGYLLFRSFAPIGRPSGPTRRASYRSAAARPSRINW